MMRTRLFLLFTALLALLIFVSPAANAVVTLAQAGTPADTLAVTQAATFDGLATFATTPTVTPTAATAGLDFSAATTYKSPHDLFEISLPKGWQNTVDETQAQYVFTIDGSQRPPLFIQATLGDLTTLFSAFGVSGPLTKPEDGLLAIKKNPPSTQFKISDLQSVKIGNLDAKMILVSIPASAQGTAAEVELITASLPNGQSILLYVQGTESLWTTGGKELIDKMIASIVVNTQNMTATPTLHPLLITATSLQQQILALTPTFVPTSAATDASTVASTPTLVATSGQ